MRPRRWRRIARWLAAGFAAWWAASFVVAWVLTMPRPSEVPARAELGGHAVEAVTTTTADGVTVRGWLCHARGATRAVVLAAGIGGNRLAMQQRATWYADRGWTALLVDLRGTGESGRERITMGLREARDLAAWHALLRARGCTTIGAHGQSLGAAAVVFTATLPEPPRWDFAVLEACYLDIDAAMAARLPWLPSWLLWTAWPMHTCAGWLTGVDRAELSPVTAIEHLAAPTLLLCGSDDTKVGPDATRRLFEASPAARKRVVTIPGVGHVDLWRTGPMLPAALAAFSAER